MLKKIVSITATVFGVAILVLGIVTVADYNGHRAGSSTEYKSMSPILAKGVTSASFGADFYTYMYKGSETMVNELSDLGSGVEAVVSAQNSLLAASRSITDGVYKIGGLLIISIGAGITAFGLVAISAAFKKKEQTKAIQTATVKDNSPNDSEEKRTDPIPEL